jgi:hypothetical protein
MYRVTCEGTVDKRSLNIQAMSSLANFDVWAENCNFDGLFHERMNPILEIITA